jgi:ABC-type transporter Mla maintaining outer membrane lipid asymmetry ATPase subunit MlaF
MNETVWLRGSLNSGKLNFLHLVAGLIVPHEGKVIVNDQDIHELGFSNYTSVLKNIGFGFDGVGLFVNQSLENNLAIQLRYHKNWSEKQIQDWLNPIFEMFKLQHLKNERPAFVSQNVYKIFLLLRTFVLAPEMMIFNNPLTNLDDIHRVAFISLIKLFKSEHGLKHIFIASEEDVLLESLNPKKIWFQDGKILEDEQRIAV